MRKKALCVGINDYPYEGNDLNGCVNDARAWAKMLSDHFDFPQPDVRILTDAEATKANIVQGLKDLLAGAAAGDALVFTNSSHGSYIPDEGGGDEPYDEVLCPYDIADKYVCDDELRELIADVPNGVRVTMILDNCHSGTATRAAVAEILPGQETSDDRRVRFLHPAHFLARQVSLDYPFKSRPKRLIEYPQSGMKEILLSGCRYDEYSYDAYLNGYYHGAMTYFAIRAIKEANYRLTYAQLHTRVKHLIRDFPQHPQLEGKAENKKRQIFV